MNEMIETYSHLDGECKYYACTHTTTTTTTYISSAKYSTQVPQE